MLLHFFHFSCFFAWCTRVSLFLRSFPSVFSFFFIVKEFVGLVSPLFLGLPTGLFVLMLLSSAGFHSATFLDHRSCLNDAVLIENLYFIFLYVSIQQVIFAFFICSSTFRVLLFMLLTQSSSSISGSSCSLSESSMKEMLLSWSQSVLDVSPSSVSLPYSCASSLFCCLSSFILGPSTLSSSFSDFCLYFLFDWMMRQSIFL